MNQPFEDPRQHLDEVDYHRLAIICSGKREAPLTAQEVKEEINAHNYWGECRYYLTIKQLEMAMIGGIIENNTKLNLDHWNGNLRQALSKIDDPFIRALNYV